MCVHFATMIYFVPVNIHFAMFEMIFLSELMLLKKLLNLEWSPFSSIFTLHLPNNNLQSPTIYLNYKYCEFSSQMQL